MSRLLRALWWTAATLIITTAVVITLARLLFPYLGEYRREIESQISQVLEYPVHIERMQAHWRGLSPQISLHSVRLLDRDGQRPLLHIHRLQADIDLWQSLWRQQLSVGNFTVAFDELSLIRDQDGQILLPGFQPEDEPSDPRDMARWLLRQDRLGLEIKSFTLHDQASGHPYQLSAIHLALNNRHDEHKLTGRVSLATPRNQTLHLGLTLRGNPVDQPNWRAAMRVKANNLSPGEWLKASNVTLPLTLAQGRYDIDLTGRFGPSQLDALSGRLAASNVRISRAEQTPSYAIDRLATQLHWQQLGKQHWRLQLDNTRLSRLGHHWPEGDFRLEYRQGATDQAPDLRLSGHYLLLQDVTEALLTLLPPEQAQRTTLAGLRPQGELHQWRVHSSEQGIAAAMNFANLSTEPYDNLPGIRGLSGSLNSSHTDGQLSLASPQTRFDWPTMFRQPIDAAVNGTVNWHKDTRGWTLTTPQLHISNADIMTQTRLNILFPAGHRQSPVLDILTDFRQGDASKVSHYLPVAIMGQDTVHWLDQGIISGQIPQGQLILKGKADDFPYAHGNGQFEVSFGIRQGRLQPEIGWPLIEGIDGQARFFGNSMAIVAERANTLRSGLSQVSVKIDDMSLDAPVLQIAGQAQGATADKLHYLLNSPLRDRFRAVSQAITPSGTSLLDLTLALDLGHSGNHQVSGNLIVQNNRLHIPAAPLDISAINGSIQINQHGLRARDLHALIHQRPFTVDISQFQGRGIHDTVISARGQIDANGLQRHFGHPLFQRFNGATAVDARLVIPSDADSPLSLAVNSSLTGMAIELSKPFNKPAKDSRRLSVRSEFAGKRADRLYIDYGDLASGVFQFDKEHIERGQLLFGQGSARLPDRPGLSIAGRFKQLSVSEWQSMLEQTEQLTSQPGQNHGLLNNLRSVELQAEQFELFQQQFNNLKLSASRQAEQWQLQVDSSQLQGRITLQNTLFAGPVTLDLDYWRLPAIGSDDAKDSNSGFDFASLPSVQLQCKAFSYNNRLLGKLEIQGRRRDNGYHIDRLELSQPQARITAQGDWARQGRNELTRLDATLTTKDAGKTMTSLGYADTLSGGDGQLQASAHWPGHPLNPELARLNGKLSFKLGKGRLLDVDPGAGRALGLLSLQALPRRLSLDFTDLFGKGMSFDKMEGSFDIIQGVASTDNLMMDGPTARVDISGKTDLVRQRYDQRALVTPYGTENLPLLGALTAATPQIGAAVLLAQQLFKKTLRRLTQFEYSISGPWSNPEVKRVDQKPAANPR